MWYMSWFTSLLIKLTNWVKYWDIEQNKPNLIDSTKPLSFWPSKDWGERKEGCCLVNRDVTGLCHASSQGPLYYARQKPWKVCCFMSEASSVSLSLSLFGLPNQFSGEDETCSGFIICLSVCLCFSQWSYSCGCISAFELVEKQPPVFVRRYLFLCLTVGSLDGKETC